MIIIEYIRAIYWAFFVKEGIEYRKLTNKQYNCQHREYIQDVQVKVIRCKHCGKQSWIVGTEDLFLFPFTNKENEEKEGV